MQSVLFITVTNCTYQTCPRSLPPPLPPQHLHPLPLFPYDQYCDHRPYSDVPFSSGTTVLARCFPFAAGLGLKVVLSLFTLESGRTFLADVAVERVVRVDVGAAALLFERVARPASSAAAALTVAFVRAIFEVWWMDGMCGKEGRRELMQTNPHSQHVLIINAFSTRSTSRQMRRIFHLFHLPTIETFFPPLPPPDNERA